MPLLGTRGAASARGFGFGGGSASITYAYVATVTNDLVIVDVTSPAAMSIVATISSFFPLYQNAGAIDPIGKILYYGTNNNSSSSNLLRSYSISNPLSPSAINTINVITPPNSIAVARAQGKVYVAGQYLGTRYFNSVTSTNGTLSSMAYLNGRAYTTLGYNTETNLCNFAGDNIYTGSYYPVPTPTSRYEYTTAGASFIDFVPANKSIGGVNSYGFVLDYSPRVWTFNYPSQTSATPIYSLADTGSDFENPRYITFRKANNTIYITGDYYITSISANSGLSFVSKYTVPNASGIYSPVIGSDEKTLFAISGQGVAGKLIAIDIQNSSSMSFVGSVTVSYPNTANGSVLTYLPT